MLSNLCERDECETCFEDELDACGHGCHDPLDHPAGESTGAGRVQDPVAMVPPTAAAPASALPRSASAGPSTPARSSQDPRAGVDPNPSRPGRSQRGAGAGSSSSMEADGAVPGGGPRPGRGGPASFLSPQPGQGALTPGLAAMAAAMSEDRGPDSLDAHVRKLMKDLGLTGFHVEKSLDVEKNRKNVSVKGWPDWTIRGPRGVLYRELKSQRGRVTPEQREWLDALAADGSDVDVWRPGCLLSGRIAAELTAISRLGGGAK